MQMAKNSSIILELGCGRNSLLRSTGIVDIADVTCVDLYQPYIDIHKKERRYKECVCQNILEYEAERHYDLVVLMDVIEHIEKDMVIAYELLGKMKKWGDKVIVTTPNAEVSNMDSVGREDNIYQAHRSVWTVKEFEEWGYKVRGLSGWKQLRDSCANVKHGIYLPIMLITSPLLYMSPQQSFHLLATYEK